MDNKKSSKNLSWDDFVKLGNPENAPKLEEEDQSKELNLSQHKVRIFLEKKHRGGKTAAVIKGIDEDQDFLSDLAKTLKKQCGVGGNAKNGEIIIQGNHREKILKILKEKGFKDVKLAGG